MLVEEKSATIRAVRFGAFELHLDAGELRKGGTLLRLKPQPARVLAMLTRRAGQPVLREELQREIWGSDTFVDFERGLNSCITQIRAALGDDPDTPRYVETLPRRGYRFIANVEYLNGSTATPGVEAPAAPAGRRGRVAAVALSLVLLAAAAAALWSRIHPAPAGTGPSSATRLLVLPFENLSGDPAQEFFSDGLSEEMITQLAGLAPQQLAVIARTSAMQYKKTEKSVAEIGRELGVEYILEGSVRRENGRVRVTAQLVRATDQTHLWAESYDRRATDLLDVQKEVSRRVAQSLAIRLLPQGSAPASWRTTANLAAYDAYLQGRHHLNQMNLPGFQKAAEQFRAAVAADPNYARAWAGLADAYNLQPWWGGLPPAEAFPQARKAAEQALALDPLLPEGHTALGFVHLYADLDFAAAEHDFRRALELNPGSALAHYWYAGVLSATGRHDAAIASMRRALELDPLSELITADAGWYLFHARRYGQAILECKRTLEAHPGNTWAMLCLADSYAQLGMHREANEQRAELLKALKAPAEVVAAVGSAGAAPQPETAGRWALRRLRSAPHYVSAYRIALVHLELGEAADALARLEQAYHDHDPFLVHLASDPRLDSLRGTARLAALLKQAGFSMPPAAD